MGGPTSPVSVRRVAILAPMPSELAPILKHLGLTASGAREPVLWRGEVGPIEVVAALTGIGMSAGAKATGRMLDAKSPDHLFIVGIAGGIGPTARIGALIVPNRVLNLDTGETLRPHPYGKREGRGTLASSHRFLDAAEARELEREGVVAIDMETAAVGAVCERGGCPWSVFRAISDRADDGSTDSAVFGLVHADGRPRPAAVALYALTRPHRLLRLLRLARGASRASRTAARAIREALRAAR